MTKTEMLQELVSRADELLRIVPQNGTVKEWNAWFKLRDDWVRQASYAAVSAGVMDK